MLEAEVIQPLQKRSVYPHMDHLLVIVRHVSKVYGILLSLTINVYRVYSVYLTITHGCLHKIEKMRPTGTAAISKQAFLEPLEEPAKADQRGLELVAAASTAPPARREPEQLVLRVLEIVRDRVESIHAGQRSMADELREIKASLPQQRKPLSPKVQDIRVIWSRRNGLCPCCQETPVCSESGRIDGAEYDHWYSRSQNRVTQTWLVCGPCNQKLRDTEYKFNARSAFEAYQAALKPFVGRQIPLGLSD